MKTGGSGAMFNTGAAARGGSPHKFGDQRYASSSYCAGVFETTRPFDARTRRARRYDRSTHAWRALAPFCRSPMAWAGAEATGDDTEERF